MLAAHFGHNEPTLSYGKRKDKAAAQVGASNPVLAAKYNI